MQFRFSAQTHFFRSFCLHAISEQRFLCTRPERNRLRKRTLGCGRIRYHLEYYYFWTIRHMQFLHRRARLSISSEHNQRTDKVPGIPRAVILQSFAGRRIALPSWQHLEKHCKMSDELYNSAIICFTMPHFGHFCHFGHFRVSWSVFGHFWINFESMWSHLSVNLHYF